MRNEEFGPIQDQQVYEAAAACTIVAEYPDDQPYPSVLVLGNTDGGRPVHVVCAYAPEEDQLIVITVYEPDANRWDSEFRQRRKP